VRQRGADRQVLAPTDDGNLVEYPPDQMQSWAVSKVSRSGEEGADLIRPDDGEYSD
jgi:hypothetical protein